MPAFSRRLMLKLAGIGATVVGLFRHSTKAYSADSANVDGTAFNFLPEPSRDRWSTTHDRVWLGAEFWANPMEDWRIVDGAAECQSKGGDRNIQLITHQVTNAAGSLSMEVEIERVEVGKRDGGVGFRLGIHSELNEYRSNCFAKNGINAGLIDGHLVLGKKKQKVEADKLPDKFVLSLRGELVRGQYQLKLWVVDRDGQARGLLSATVPPDSILGNVALVNNFAPKPNKGIGSRFRFRNWKADGEAFTITPKRAFGPILWSMYSLSDSRSDEGFVLKLTALTGPLGAKDNHDVELRVVQGGESTGYGKEPLNTDAWTATFRIPRWNEKEPASYHLIYRERSTDGSEVGHEWKGSIKANPTGRPLRLGALTCQNDYAFPYEPVANNVVKLDPDLLYFSGDQLYESHGGYGIIRDPAGPAILNYLRKFYMFGWAFREAMRDRPTLCIADDHDVFQGNIWGEGGKKMGTGPGVSKGGYREPARMVNVVHKTCASHHPDYFDPTPCEQGISVYYGDMVYGGVSFAILGDRQFKSGPDRVDTGSGRADHVSDRKFDTAKLDQPGLELLGERQEKFLEAWAADWRNCQMKVLLSQTVFAGVATHHGGYNGYLKADLDSSGWPQTPRQRAVRLLNRAMPLHINGDQHLTTLVQYGVENQRDGCWSFCTPAIAVGYPRWWRPDEVDMPHKNRPSHQLPNTGEYLDGFGNRVYVYAVGNPVVGKAKNRYERAHEKGSGFGMVTIDLEARTYFIESFRFLIDATDGKKSNQFPGWPVTIHQEENKGENRLG